MSFRKGAACWNLHESLTDLYAPLSAKLQLGTLKSIGMGSCELPPVATCTARQEQLQEEGGHNKTAYSGRTCFLVKVVVIKAHEQIAGLRHIHPARWLR